MDQSIIEQRVGIRRASGRLRKAAKEHASGVCIIPERLYFMAVKSRPKVTPKKHFFCIDNILRYEAFFIDFGPLNLGCLYKFCELLNAKLKDKALASAAIHFYTANDSQKIANASYLIGSFMVLYLGFTPEEAYEKIEPIAFRAAPFRDASMGVCTYKCSVAHCINAVFLAKRFRFLDFDVFNVDEYEYYERVECGDLNIIIPGKFLAFAGPSATNIDADGYPALTPAYYIPIWKKFKISTIIRLNKKCYDKRKFTQHGFEHYDLYYTDGTCPSRSILKKFLQICENAPGVIAVHCKAGLGRTGSCIGCYMMKHYGWSASDCIAWLRTCRPGSVIGPQQQFLEEQQPIMWREGMEYRKMHQKLSRTLDPLSPAIRSKNGPLNGHENPHHRGNGREREVYQNKSPEGGKPLATDPGQDQGRALREAKRSPKLGGMRYGSLTKPTSGRVGSTGTGATGSSLRVKGGAIGIPPARTSDLRTSEKMGADSEKSPGGTRRAMGGVPLRSRAGMY